MLRLGRFSTLSFDCYGTLIDWESGILAFLRPWAQGQGLSISDDGLLEAFARAESAQERATPGLPYRNVLAEVLKRLARELDATANEEETLEFSESVSTWPPFPDSSDALAHLSEHFDLVVLSNVDRESFRGSEARLGIKFDRVYTAEDIGSYKPDPRNFHYLLDRLGEHGVARGEVLHVAQSLHHDVEPAKKVGLSVVWVDRRHDKAGFGATPPPEEGMPQPDLRVESLAELAELHRSQLSES